MILTDATDTQIDAVLDGTHALWADGLDRAAYGACVRALRDTPWGRRGGYRFLALCDDGGRVLSAMKLYRFEARAGDLRITLGGVGALFTPPDQRGRGRAAALLDRAHAAMAARGDAASLLHSEIGGGWYERLGYRTIDPDAASLRVLPQDSGAGAAAVTRRRLGPQDEPHALLRLREVEDARVPFALIRDAAYQDYLRLRAEIPTRHLGDDRWQSRLVTHEQGGEVAGFLWSLLREPSEASAHDGGAAARVLEFAESAPGASLPFLLDDLFAECRRRGVTEIEAWQASEIARRDPRLRRAGALRRTQPPGVIPMWRPLRDEVSSSLEGALSGAPLRLSDVF